MRGVKTGLKVTDTAGSKQNRRRRIAGPSASTRHSEMGGSGETANELEEIT